MGVRRAMVLDGDARQATSEGKSGPVETELTGLAATALRNAGTVCMHEVRGHDSHLAQPKDQSSWI